MNVFCRPEMGCKYKIFLKHNEIMSFFKIGMAATGM